MKKRLKLFLIIIVGILFWYYRPLTIQEVIQKELYDIESIKVSLFEPSGSFFYDEYGNPQSEPYINVYKLDISSNKDSHYENILSILQNTKYHSKLRNSLPFKFDISNQDFIYSGYVWVTSDDDTSCISFLGDNRIAIYNHNQKSKVYHMSNQKILNDLAEYMIKHGSLEEK